MPLIRINTLCEMEVPSASYTFGGQVNLTKKMEELHSEFPEYSEILLTVEPVYNFNDEGESGLVCRGINLIFKGMKRN